MTESTVWERLAAPLPDDQVSWKPAGGGHNVAYLTVQAVENRLDDVLTPANWVATFEILHDSLASGGRIVVRCELTVFVDDAFISKQDVGEADTDAGEAYKAAWSDSLKRAARRFGVGRYLAFKEPDAAQRRVAPPAQQSPTAEAVKKKLEQGSTDGAAVDGRREFLANAADHYGVPAGEVIKGLGIGVTDWINWEDDDNFTKARALLTVFFDSGNVATPEAQELK